ncbi:MAG: GNAT family N-acetyltransferase [Culicoidibacterales bacterium]
MRFTTNEVDTFSLFEDKALVGTITFSVDLMHNVIIIEHVEIDAQFQHKGFGEMLMHTFLAQLHRKEIHVSPACPYAKAYLEHHPVNFVDWNYQKK